MGVRTATHTCGWKPGLKGIEILWRRLSDVPTDCMELITCGCKKNAALLDTAALRGHVKKIIYLVPTTKLSRSHDIRSRAHDIRSRANDIIISFPRHNISFPRHNYLVPTT